jgi:G3E family GTPase
MDDGCAIPVSVISGFLGAGKTTLVNHILRGSHGRLVGVLINEFGEIGIDGKLIHDTAAPVIELPNGCMCCATQGDSRRALDALLSCAKLDAIVIETSGLANPGPIAHDIAAWRFARDLYLDGVVTVIDALNFDENLEHAEVAFDQIVNADLCLINKVDLVGDHAVTMIEQGLGKLNPDARTLRCVSCCVPIDMITGAIGHKGNRTFHRESHRHSQFESIVLTTAEPLDAQRFDDWLGALPRSIYRAKGFARISGLADPVLVQVVGGRRTVRPHPASGIDDGTALVLIGREIELEALAVGLKRCAATLRS